MTKKSPPDVVDNHKITKPKRRRTFPARVNGRDAETPWKQELVDMGIGDTRTMTEEGLEKLGLEFIRHCYQDIDSTSTRRLTARRFFIEKGIPEPTVEGWRKRNDLFNQRVQFGMRILGEKLNIGMLRKELEPTKTAFQIHNYLPEWKEYQKHNNDMQVELQSAIKKAVQDMADKGELNIKIIDCDHGNDKSK